MDTTPPPPTTVKEAVDILDANMANEKAIRIFERPLIPMDLVDSAISMDSYLTQLREDSKFHEKYRLRSAKAVESRRRNSISNSLEQKARQIKVEPSNKQAAPVLEGEKRKVVICKQEPTETIEGSLVVQKRIGIVVVCDKCTHRFTHYSKDIGKQYFCSCSRCHANIRLKHYS